LILLIIFSNQFHKKYYHPILGIHFLSNKLITFIKDRPGHDKRYAIDASKISNQLGWKPSLVFQEGLEKTIDWYLSNKKWLDYITSGDYLTYYENQYSKK
tara:strand:+ start:351 stop:650 length:300 start_codon:yes stop_codon:yes gene_type:complete